MLTINASSGKILALVLYVGVMKFEMIITTDCVTVVHSRVAAKLLAWALLNLIITFNSRRSVWSWSAVSVDVVARTLAFRVL